MNIPDFSLTRVINYKSIPKWKLWMNLIFQNDERQNHLEHIIWKTLIFESRKPDRKSRIEGERREGNNNAFNEEKTSLVSNGIAYSEALARVRWVPSLFFPFFFFSIFFFFCLEFSLERAKRPRDIDVPSSPPSAMAQSCRRRCFRVSCEERPSPPPFLSIEHSVRFTDTDARDCE